MPANVDDLARAVTRLETTIGRVGIMVQEQGQQLTATASFLARLQDLLGDFVTATLQARQQTDALSGRIEAGASDTMQRLDALAALIGAGPRAASATPDTPPVATTETFVVVRPLGALGNRMIQHMVAMSIVAKVPGARISRVNLPEWGRDEPDIAEAPKPKIEIGTMRVDVGAIAARMRRGEAKSVAITGYAQNVANFLEVDAYRATFVGPPEIIGYGPKVLLISLRMAEILSADFPPYVLLPIAFYRELIEQTGLKPIFFGQLTPSPYLDDLRAAFPDARFVPGRNPIHDFETIRRSRNIVVSVSTFTWLAAWLSEAQQIFLPLAGLFNPMFGRIYGGGHDLVPRDDERYRMFLFPVGIAVEQSRLPGYHAAIEGTWCELTSAEIDNRLDGQRLTARSLPNHLALFDEEYYLRRYPEIKTAVTTGLMKSGKDHYELHGFREGRNPYEIDMDYMIRYPDAGLAISNGEFTDPYHFHAERGHALGYVKTRRELDAAPNNQTPARTTKKRKAQPVEA